MGGGRLSHGDEWWREVCLANGNVNTEIASKPNFKIQAERAFIVRRCGEVPKRNGYVHSFHKKNAFLETSTHGHQPTNRPNTF